MKEQTNEVEIEMAIERLNQGVAELRRRYLTAPMSDRRIIQAQAGLYKMAIADWEKKRGKR